jgi:hypothetical protein
MVEAERCAAHIREDRQVDEQLEAIADVEGRIIGRQESGDSERGGEEEAHHGSSSSAPSIQREKKGFPPPRFLR